MDEESVMLYNATRRNEHHHVSASLTCGADVNFIASPHETVDVRTPLRAACAHANVKLIRTLVASGADIFAHFERDRWTALHSAAHAGHDQIMRLLFAEVHGLHEHLMVDGFALLHVLAECVSAKLVGGGADVLMWLLRQMPGLEICALSSRLGYKHWTPLHVVCARGRVNVATCLLKTAADLTIRTGEFALRSPLLNAFCQAGVNPHGGSHVASIESDIEVQDSQFLDKGLLPIHLAAFGGHIRCLQMLVKRGQSVNAKTSRHHWTPLMFAVWNGSVAMVRAILSCGGLSSINFADRRADCSEWSPLALAVSKASVEMAQTLVAAGASPVRNYSAADFPARAFLHHNYHCGQPLPGASENRWSGSDHDISLIHLAVLRGNLAMLQFITPIVRSCKVMCDSMNSDLDPVADYTAKGWSPAILAALMHVVDPHRRVRIELLELTPDPSADENLRSEVVLELLATGRSLLEDRPDLSPPVLPQRFEDVSEHLVCYCVDEFARLCRAADAERASYRTLHKTLCAACQLDRRIVVAHLLETRLCDPRCKFLKSIQSRPLHIASACGFGFMAQLLLDYRADPLEADENGEMPLVKLTHFYARKLSHLQSTCADLEAQVRADEGGRIAALPAASGWGSWEASFVPSGRASWAASASSPMSTPRGSKGIVRDVGAANTAYDAIFSPWRSPRSMRSSPRMDAVLHDSRM